MKRIVFLVIMLFPLFVMAQNERNKNLTKYEEFESKTGSIIKYVDKSKDNCLLDKASFLKTKIRTVYGEGKNLYFLILEKNKMLGIDPSTAFIEYTDLVEINKALARLSDEVDGDCELKPDYLQNVFTSVDGFLIGYYVEKSKATWTVRLEYGAESYTIKKIKEFADFLINAQKEIETMIAQNSK